MGDKRPRFYSRAKTAQMFERIRATEEANKRQQLEAQILRQSDPFERAKLALQRRGLKVYAHAIIEPSSGLIVVGTRLMTREQVIRHAERLGR